MRIGLNYENKAYEFIRRHITVNGKNRKVFDFLYKGRSMEQLNDRKSKKKCRPESKQEDIECTGNRMLRAVSTERR